MKEISLLLFIASQARALQIAAMSDIHILPKYDPLVNNTCYCSVGCKGGV